MSTVLRSPPATAECGDVHIVYDTFGDPDESPLLLIAGLGDQAIDWREGFCLCLAERGHWVIRFDNRDIGLSSKIEDGGLPDLMQAMEAYQQGKPVEAPYSLSDMAADTVGLMDALQIEKAHVCGQSMGGMIAQIMTIEYPQRLHGIVSLESTTGDQSLPTASPAAMDAMMSSPPLEMP